MSCVYFLRASLITSRVTINRERERERVREIERWEVQWEIVSEQWQFRPWEWERDKRHTINWIRSLLITIIDWKEGGGANQCDDQVVERGGRNPDVPILPFISPIRSSSLQSLFNHPLFIHWSTVIIPPLTLLTLSLFHCFAVSILSLFSSSSFISLLSLSPLRSDWVLPFPLSSVSRSESSSLSLAVLYLSLSTYAINHHPLIRSTRWKRERERERVVTRPDILSFPLANISDHEAISCEL